MDTTNASSTNGGSQTRLFSAIDTYPWDADPEFQAGLQAIVGSNTDPRQVERLTLRARCFYYARSQHEPLYRASTC